MYKKIYYYFLKKYLNEMKFLITNFLYNELFLYYKLKIFYLKVR